MEDYILNGNVYEVKLQNGKTVKIAKDWVHNSMRILEAEEKEIIKMWLEDEGYLENQEVEELTKKAKENNIKLVATTEKVKKKTQKERTQKENPVKQSIIAEIADFLATKSEIVDINIENKTKLITFKCDNREFKLDLVEKRAKKGN